MTFCRRPLIRTSMVVLLAASTCSLGDVIVTTDGERHQGEIKRVPEGWRVTRADGSTVVVPGNKIKSIDLSNTPAAGGSAMEALQSLRRSVEHTQDIDKIIERYDRFIENAKDEQVLGEARKDQQTWVDRRQRKMVKVGRRWVTRDEQRTLALQVLQRVEDVRQLIKSGKTKEAEKVIQGLLDEDPANVSALYLMGTVRAKDGNFVEAKKHFTAVQQALPDHPPTLLNLAVILLRQKQWGPAASMMEQAMAGAPNVQFLVDQSAELANLLPEDQQKTPAAQKLARRFAEQDAQLQATMAKREMYRWGATWVDKAMYDRIMQVDVDIKKKLADLQSDFDLTQNRVTRIDQEVADNQRAMKEIESRSWTRTADGSLVRVPYPSAYYDMQREVTRLNGEKKEMLARLDTIRVTAKKVQAEYPVPKFTGALRMIEEDGVPVMMPDDAPPAAETPPPVPGTTRDPPKPPATLPPASTQPTEGPPPIIRIGPGPGAEQ